MSNSFPEQYNNIFLYVNILSLIDDLISCDNHQSENIPRLDIPLLLYHY